MQGIKKSKASLPSKGGFQSIRIYKPLTNRRVENPPLEGREAAFKISAFLFADPSEPVQLGGIVFLYYFFLALSSSFANASYSYRVGC